MTLPEVNRWSSGHTLAVVWAVSFGGTTVLWATGAAWTVVVAPALLLAIIATGWLASWWMAVGIAAAASWMWTRMDLVAVRLEVPAAQGLSATILASLVFLAVGQLSRHAWEHRRNAHKIGRELEAVLERQKFQASFFAMAAHEVGTPLTPLKIQVEAMLRQPAAAQFETGLLRIKRNVNRLERLSKELLEASRVESGAIHIERHPVDLHALVEDVVAAARPMAEAQHVQLTVDAEPLMPEADADRLRQVVWNLVRNALKFTPAGGAVQVRAYGDGDRVRIDVCDDGLGMDPEQLEALFQPFTQFHRHHAAEGSGLGLFVSQGICRAHGGSIEATSKGPGLGSTFSIQFPMRVPVKASRSPVVAAAPTPA